MNVHVVKGRIGKDAVVRQAGNTKVTSFSLGWSDPFGDKETTWFNVSYFGDRGEKLSGYLTKGKEIVVSGTTKLRKYNDKDGNERYSLDLRANEISFTSGGQRSDDTSNTSAGIEDDDSVPF